MSIAVQPGSVVGCLLASVAVARGAMNSRVADSVILVAHRVATCFNQGVP